LLVLGVLVYTLPLQLGKDFYKTEFEEAEKATEEAVKEVTVRNCLTHE
jgi:hypothetical protein